MSAYTLFQKIKTSRIVRLNSAALFFFFALFLLPGNGASSQPNEIGRSYTIGEFVELALDYGERFDADQPGNGFFVKGRKLLGWPRSTGEIRIAGSPEDIILNIRPMISEMVTTERMDYSVVWNSVDRNEIARDFGDGKFAPLTDRDSVKWQLASDPTGRVLAWLDFPRDGGSDQIILRHVDTGRETVIRQDDTLHRKPLFSDKHLYWYREELNAPDGREISIVRMTVDGKGAPEVVISSRFPDMITDYTVLANDTVVAIRKNHDQQRSDIVRIDPPGAVSVTALEDSFAQNLNSYGNTIAYETKRHGGLWTVVETDLDSGDSRIRSDDGRSVLFADFVDGETSTKTIEPYDFEAIYEELLVRYSPPIVGLSRYDNTFGTLSISEAAIVRSLITVAESRDDYYYWHLAAERAGELVNRTDRAMGIVDWAGKSGTHFSIKAFSNEDRHYISYLVHDSSIMDALLLVALKLEDDEYLRHVYPDLKEKIRRISREIVQYYAGEAISKENDKYHIVEDGESYLMFPYGSPFAYDGINLPFNMMNGFIRPLHMFSQLTGEERYENLALSLGRLFKRHLIYREDSDSYVWPYWWGLYSRGWSGASVSTNTPQLERPQRSDISDVDHASLDIRAMRYLSNASEIFDNSDLRKIANTMRLNVEDGDYRSPLLIDGRLKSANYNSIEYLWGEASRYDASSRALFRKQVSDFPYVQDAFTPTARYELVGLAHAMADE